MFSPLQGHLRGHLVMFSLPKRHPRGQYRHRKGTSKCISVHFVLWKDTLSGTLSHFVHWKDTEEGTFGFSLPAF